jgi:hypothetical protein
VESLEKREKARNILGFLMDETLFFQWERARKTFWILCKTFWVMRFCGIS